MWKLVGYLYREVCNAMDSMCAAANTISFEQWLSPRVVFCGRQFHKLGGYHPFAALVQVLIASFTKILSAVSAQAESEQAGGSEHGYVGDLYQGAGEMRTETPSGSHAAPCIDATRGL